MDTEEKGRPLRVLAAVVAGDQMMSLSALHFASMLAVSRCSGIEAEPLMMIGSILQNNRSTAARYAREHGFDCLLFMDSDMTYPPDTLLRLLKHGDLPVIGATYAQRNETRQTHGFDLEGKRLDVSAGGPSREVASLPTGCMLIRRRVLDTLAAQGDEPFFRMPWADNAANSRGEDYDFCSRVRGAGFSVHVDPDLSLCLGHIGITIYTIPTSDGIVQ